MKTQHTKGEWKIGKSLRCLVGTNEPEVLAIADCNIDGDINKEEQQANAKLIAAAPELLEALDYIMSEINSNPMSVQYFDLRLIKQANEAIKKVTQ